VRNNMQVISSLLSIESASISDKRVLEYFRETESRIKSMALVHEKLYKSDSLSAINVGEYIHSLISDLVSTYSIQTVISTDEKLEDDILIELERAIPFGLIIHEIITNSLTHAFPGRETGNIFILTEKEADEILDKLDEFHDAELGINWLVIESYIESYIQMKEDKTLDK